MGVDLSGREGVYLGERKFIRPVAGPWDGSISIPSPGFDVACREWRIHPRGNPTPCFRIRDRGEEQQ
jgi:hypothetical protein